MSVSQNYSAISPSLSLDFAAVQALDPRITYSRASTATYYGTRTALAEQNLLLQSQTPFPSPWALNGGYVGSLGSELVTNGDFVDSSGWTLGNGWSIGSGVATANTTLSSERLSRAWSGENNKSYLVTATITMLATPNAAAAIQINIGGTGQDVNVLSQTNLQSGTTYSISAVARPTTVNAGAFLVRVSSNANYAMNYTIDNVSIKEATQNSVTAPDGTATASTLTANVSNAAATQSVTANAADYTFSVYLRRVTGTGDVQIQAGSGTYVTQTITSTWARYTVTQTLAAGSRTAGIRLVTSGDQVEVWGAQLEQRSTVTAYTPTTTQPITNYIPVLETAASGVARFDHNPTTFESLGLLIEQQSTNLLTYSEQFDDASWNKTQSTVTANTIIAPDGTLTGDKLIENTNADVHWVSKSGSGSTGTYTLSAYAKAAERTWVYLIDNSTVTGRAFFNLSNGTLGTISGTGSPSATITSVGNGWYRLTMTITTAGTPIFRLGLAPSDNTTSYTGNGYSGIFIWGAQLEASAFPTSYIPTVASQVTRAVDSASMTGTNFSSWYNQGEGTIYGDCTYFGVNQAITKYLAYIGNSTTNFLSIYAYGSIIGAFVIANGVAQVEMYTGNTSENANTKQILAYKVNDFATARNGGAVVVDSFGILPLVNNLYIGGDSINTGKLNGRIKKLAYYPQRLTDTQLQALTG